MAGYPASMNGMPDLMPCIHQTNANDCIQETKGENGHFFSIPAGSSQKLRHHDHFQKIEIESFHKNFQNCRVAGSPCWTYSAKVSNSSSSVGVDPLTVRLRVWTPDTGTPTSSEHWRSSSPVAHTLSRRSRTRDTPCRPGKATGHVRTSSSGCPARSWGRGSLCRPCRPCARLYMRADRQRLNSPRCRHHLAGTRSAPVSKSAEIDSEDSAVQLGESGIHALPLRHLAMSPSFLQEISRMSKNKTGNLRIQKMLAGGRIPENNTRKIWEIGHDQREFKDLSTIAGEKNGRSFASRALFHDKRKREGHALSCCDVK
ncbi:uncharacterized protein [Narcine bancroftii]|uniref:uncharacterized protein n=1 Tax=Narcine bancroftii TaxID=1343680 RepID=UPI003831F6CE